MVEYVVGFPVETRLAASPRASKGDGASPVSTTHGMGARLASTSSELPASCSLVAVLLEESILIMWACICSGFPFRTFHTLRASSGVPSERRSEEQTSELPVT